MLFGTLIVSNLIGLILEILCSYASDIYETNQLLSNIIYKSYLLYLIFWISTITYYVYSMNKTIMTAEDIIHNKNEEIKMLKSRIEDTIALIKLMYNKSSSGEFSEIHLDDIIAKLKTGTSCYENTRDSKELLDLKYLES